MAESAGLATAPSLVTSDHRAALLVGMPQGQWYTTDIAEDERSRAMAKKKLIKGLWLKSDVNLLKKLFPNNPTAHVAARLGRPVATVKRKAYRMGLKKSKKRLKSLRRT
jgi:hypothetical protein